LAITEKSNTLCSFGSPKPPALNLSNPDFAKAEFEKTRIYSTYASIDCSHRENCEPYDIEIGQNFSRLDRNLSIIWTSLLRNAIAIAISTSIFLMIFSFLIRNRLQALSLACDAIKVGGTSLRLNVTGSDEISKVAIALEKLNNELQDSEKEKDKQRVSLLAASKLSALGEMAGGVAHEINNPLGIIQLLTSQMQDLLRDETFDRTLAQEKLSKILKTITRITKIVNGLRTFSRNSSNDPFEEVSVAPLVEEALSLCAERLKNHGVKITNEAVNESLVFFGNGTEISQVLVNLLNNASDAISNTAEKWILVSANDSGNEVQIRVTNSGSKISDDVRARLFQPFFTTKEIGKGTGLGLSVSLGILKRHGGTLQLDTDCPNTCFLLSLPKVKSAALEVGLLESKKSLG